MHYLRKIAILGVAFSCLGLCSLAHPQAAKADWDDYVENVYRHPYRHHHQYYSADVNPWVSTYPSQWVAPAPVVVQPYGYYDRHPVLNGVINSLIGGWGGWY